MRAFVSSLLCCSCVAYHQPGALAHATVRGPLEVSVRRIFASDIPVGGVVLEYRFGNLVDHAVPVDLRELRVEIGGHSADLYDPRQEVRELPLAPRGEGSERLLYLAWGNAETSEVCVYLAFDCVEVLP
jgi:hypothetical protein